MEEGAGAAAERASGRVQPADSHDPAAATERRRFLWIGAATSLALTAISLMPREGPENYRWSFLFLVPLLWAGHAARAALHLRPLHFALGASALLLHQLGAFGCYYETYLGVEFDAYVHGWFGFVAGLILGRALDRRFRPSGAQSVALVVLLVTGIGGLHEIMEAASTLLLGKHGMYVPDDPYDTHKDLLNGVIGASVAAVLRIWRR